MLFENVSSRYLWHEKRLTGLREARSFNYRGHRCGRLSSTLYKIGRDFGLCGAARVNQFAAVCIPCVSGSIGFQPMDEQIS